jgi:hypothetical protein
VYNPKELQLAAFKSLIASIFYSEHPPELGLSK